MSATAQSHRVTPGSGYSQYSEWGNRPAASVAKQTDKQAAKLYSLDMHWHGPIMTNWSSWTSRSNIARDSETTVPWFEQREFISDSDSDEDN